MIRKLAVVIALLLSGLPVTAQTDREAPRVPASLPVRKVVLFKNGLGFFEHVGQVIGNESVEISLPSRQLDDVLKSLTVIDRGRGQVSGVTYDSSELLDRRFSELAVKPTLNQGLLDFLNQVAGAEVEIHSATALIAGRLMGAEIRQKKSGEYITNQTLQVSVFTRQGEVRTVELPFASTLRFVKPELAADLNRYLELVDSAHRRDVHHLKIETRGSGSRPLHISYTSEAPIWKTTYRIVLDEKQKPLLQGWAVVDNTTPNEWNNVELSLVAGDPISFIQNISQPLYGRRPVIPMAEGVQVTPQMHQATLEIQTGSTSLSGIVRDPNGVAIPGASVRALTELGNPVKQARADANGRYSIDLPPGTYRLDADAPGFALSRVRGISIEAGRTTSYDLSLNLGNVSQSVEVTASAGEVSTSSATVSSAGRGRAFALKTAPPPPAPVPLGQAMRENAPEAAQTGALGEQFEYKLPHPVTIGRNQSALLPIVHTEIEGEKVALFNEGSGRTPRWAVWLKNTSGLTLAAGSFLVLDANTFAGEGLTGTIHPEERRLLSYALDKSVEITANRGSGQNRVQRVEIARGAMKMTTQIEERRVYTIRNNDQKPRTVILEHPVRNGWTFVETPKPSESTSDFHRFRVETQPKATTEFTVREVNPQSTTYALESINPEQIAIWVRERTVDPEMERALQTVIVKQTEIAALQQKAEALEREVEAITKDQTRVRDNLGRLGNNQEEAALRKRYVLQLSQQEDRLSQIKSESARLQESIGTAEKQLDEYMQGLVFDRKV